jgi:aspartate racemase
MAKHIGIVACSAEGAALCYRTICTEAPREMGEYAHPEVTMHTYPLSEYMKHIWAGEWEGVAELMLSSGHKVAEAGADFAICPDNTIHQALEFVKPKSPIPWLHIAETVAEEAQKHGFAQLGILGTKYLMTGPVYPKALRQFGIAHEIPAENDRERIDKIIFDELVNGLFIEESRRYFNNVMRALKQRGCDAAVLGCTEIPLIVDPSDSPLPTLDSTRLLARAAIREALEGGTELGLKDSWLRAAPERAL